MFKVSKSWRGRRHLTQRTAGSRSGGRYRFFGDTGQGAILGATFSFACFLLSAHPVLAQTDEMTLLKRAESGDIWGRFRGSSVSTSLGVGSGTFVRGYADNPLVSQTASLAPRFLVRGAQTLRAGFSLSCEYTPTDNSTGRRCNPSDLRISYHDLNLGKDPYWQGRIFGNVAAFLPTSYASRNNRTVANLRATVGYLKILADNKLQLFYAFGFQKYLPRSKTRRVATTPGSVNVNDPSIGATGSGGRFNDNFLLSNTLGTTYFATRRVFLSASLSVLNFVRFAAPDDAFSSFPDDGRDQPDRRGRADLTSGSLVVSFAPIDHVTASIGISSSQPAKTADNSRLRFPFFDFESPASNFTRVFASTTVIY